MAGELRAARRAVTAPFPHHPNVEVLGYALVANGRALVSAGDGSADGIPESTWRRDCRGMVVLPSRTAALSLAIAIDAGPDVEIRPVVAERRPPMTKREIRKLASSYADDLAAISGDADAAREAWIDVGASNAGWKRRGLAKARTRKSVRKGGGR